ncbi:MAG: C40 family peptidase [Bacilli bacterium]|nr:C40 family peptidase [Bacilli bacterium]
MKTNDVPSIQKNKKRLRRFLIIVLFICLSGRVCHTYKSIGVEPLENASVEIGSTEYDIHNLIKNINGEIISVKQDIDTSILGSQEVVLEVKKDNIIKDVSMEVSVVDSTAPVIAVKDEVVTITLGDSYDLRENIENVSDFVDGDLAYFEETNQSRLKAYNIQLDGDMYSPGDHDVVVSAIDKSGNIANYKYVLSVVEPEPEPEPEPVYYEPVYYDLPPNAAGNDLVSIAYSYLGYPYGPGNYPGAFDCSGFVQYVYSQVGIGISRSTSTQIYDGSPVSYDDMQPGDIIVWGYGWDAPTHSAMYVGDGQMIHSANYSTGVILSDVQGWLNGSGTQIVTIRRI